MGKQFFYERYQSQWARLLHIVLCIVSSLILSQLIAQLVIYGVQQYVPHWQGDPVFFLIVPLLFAQWLIALMAMFNERVHWSTGVSWAMAALVLFMELMELT